MTIIASQNADWLREKAVPVANAMLSANEKVDVLYGHNDPMAEGAYLASAIGWPGPHRRFCSSVSMVCPPLMVVSNRSCKAVSV